MYLGGTYDGEISVSEQDCAGGGCSNDPALVTDLRNGTLYWSQAVTWGNRAGVWGGAGEGDDRGLGENRAGNGRRGGGREGDVSGDRGQRKRRSCCLQSVIPPLHLLPRWTLRLSVTPLRSNLAADDQMSMTDPTPPPPS